MLDDAVVYNTGHLFGFFSIFNSDAIKNVSLIKGGMPAQYGGRLSVRRYRHERREYEENGSGRRHRTDSIPDLYPGPDQKDKASFMISARRTYIDALVKPFVPKSSAFHGSGYYFMI